MRFLDIQTGHTFDALWTSGQSKGYTFWFPAEQSVDLTYTMPICMITDNDTPIRLSMEDNDIFKFILHSTEETVDGVVFGLPEYSMTQIADCEKISDGLYVHKVYVSASSSQLGEYVIMIDVEGYGYIRIGADFYGENESLSINLSNYGIDIPNTIQKAIYESNVHEDYKDSILLNRKFKELLSNYWDVMANRGSYKSLQNSLDWFEWGDVIHIREMWKRENNPIPTYDEKELMSLLEEKYTDYVKTFTKTTYLALTASLQTDSDEYDVEGNPVLTDIVHKWGRDDLSLKISLLNEFFGKYFLPIHLSIYTHCVEDVVYTNTIKAISGGVVTQQDFFGNFDSVECNIKDGSTYNITSVRAQVTENTKYGVTSNMFTRHTHFGVDKFPMKGMVSHDSLKTFSAQYYTGPGVIIPFELSINTTEPREFLKYMSVSFIPDGYTERDTITFTDKVFQRGGKITINFNFLSKIARDYDMVFTFILSSSKTLTKRVRFSTVDIDNLVMSVYKIVAKDDKNGFTYDDFYNNDMNDHYFKRQKSESTPHTIQLPYLYDTSTDFKGVKLNRVIAIDVDKKKLGLNVHIRHLALLQFTFSNYLTFYQYDNDGSIKTVIAISKKFNQPSPTLDKFNVIKNHLGYFPQFHTLERIGGDTIDDYTISQYDAICVIPEIHKYGNTYERFRYGHIITDTEWQFVNTSMNITTDKPGSAIAAIVSSTDRKVMEDGYYDIIFKYRLSGNVKELRLNGAFRKKTI